MSKTRERECPRQERKGMSKTREKVNVKHKRERECQNKRERECQRQEIMGMSKTREKWNAKDKR